MSLEEEEQENHTYDLDGDIVFHNVSIEIDKKTIIKNLNLSIQKGEKIAILGENGSGKSILTKAILGFYPVAKGNIYFNYHNTKQLNNENIRKYVDLVSGEADLFTGTILKNIKLDAADGKTKNNPEDEQIIKVSKQAEIYKDIQRFAEKYQTIVGEKGAKLSGGQKQRILIARALLRNKPILIFDNAFSKLDNQTSHQILQNLIDQYPETTMIFITHKPEIQNFVNRCLFLGSFGDRH